MVDCGFAVKNTLVRLANVGLGPMDIDAIVVTHEHEDHLGGVFKFSRKFGTPVYLTHGTWRAALRTGRASKNYLSTGKVCLVDSHTPFQIGSLSLSPFPVPHDALEPIQLLLNNESMCVGILTDCGSVTPHLIGMLNQADALVLESNHCPDMLSRSSYPESLKRRVGGDYGHLSNETACQILTLLDSGRLRYVVAAHLSKNTNSPDLVRSMWSRVLTPRNIRFDIACQENGFDWWNFQMLVQSVKQCVNQ